MKKISKYQLKGIQNTKIDLSGTVLYVGNQGRLGSCTAFGISKAREMIMHPSTEDLSPWYLYWKSLQHDRIEGDDYDGTYIQDALDVLKNFGCCETKFWKTNDKDKKYKGKIKKGAEENASLYKIGKWSFVEKHIDAIRWTVNQGLPVIVSVTNFEGLRRPGKGGVITNTGTTKPKGHHCMTVVGYDDETRLVKILNSWGDNWADKGYCYMGYDYFMMIIKEAYYISNEKTEEKTAFTAFRDFVLNIVTFPIKLIQNGIAWFKQKPLF